MNIAEIIEAIKTITDHKLEIEDLLDIMTVWYRDVMMIKATNDINKVVFADELSCLREKARTGSYEGIETILSAVKTAQKRLKANVNFELTIELLLLTIREN